MVRTPASVLISVDPSTRKGAYAFFRDSHFQQVHKFNLEKSPDRLGTLTYIAEQVLGVEYPGRKVLVVEGQFLGVNPKTLISLVESRMVWEQAGRHFRWEVCTTSPDVWQAQMCNIRRGTKREDGVPVYVETARRLFGREFSPDEAAAVLIGEHFLSQDAYKRKVGA